MNETGFNATTVANSTAAPSILLLFLSRVLEDPAAAIVEFPSVLVIALSFTIVPMALSHLIDYLMNNDANAFMTAASIEDIYLDKDKKEAALTFARSAPAKSILWQIGVGQKSISVIEDGNLRAFAFSVASNDGLVSSKKTIPTKDDILNTLLRAMADPMLDKPTQNKPQTIAFLETRQCSSDTVKAVAEFVKKTYDIKITTMEEIASDLPAIRKSRSEALRLEKLATGPSFMPEPKRACASCKKVLEVKSMNCGACRAIIYCSTDCQKEDWPNHKEGCKVLKKIMENSSKHEDFDDFPFPFYNLKDKAILYDYNQVNLLEYFDVHNVGLYRRLCGCINQVPYGCLSLEMLSALFASGENLELQAKALGLPASMLPLTLPLEVGVDVKKLNNWADYFKASRLELNSPLALILEYPMTIFYILKEFSLPKSGAWPNKFVVHMAGAEKEADLIPLFPILLNLFPNMDLIIHLIGPAIPTQIEANSRRFTFGSKNNTSKLTVSLISTPYLPQYVNGVDIADGKPDVVLGLNSELMHQSWVMTLKALIESNTRAYFTEKQEFNIEIMRKNLEKVGAKVGKTSLNPFRAPVRSFAVEAHLPSFSNGFIFGI